MQLRGLYVVCRDPYHQTCDRPEGATFADLETYEIWFDSVATQPARMPTCRTLLRQHTPR